MFIVLTFFIYWTAHLQNKTRIGFVSILFLRTSHDCSCLTYVLPNLLIHLMFLKSAYTNILLPFIIFLRIIKKPQMNKMEQSKQNFGSAPSILSGATFWLDNRVSFHFYVAVVSMISLLLDKDCTSSRNIH